jgi:hypothetical protein
MFYPPMMLATVVSALIGRRWAILFVAIGSAFAYFPGREAIGIPLYLSTIGALTGLPLRWGIAELVDELRPHRDNP